MNQKSPTCRGPSPSYSQTATLLGIAEELRCHILKFLPYNEISRCALICRTMHTTVKKSVDLQYAIELGAQRLVPVHPPTVSTSECLRILREKANAWSFLKFDSTKTFQLGWSPNSWSVSHRQLRLARHPVRLFKYRAHDTGPPENEYFQFKVIDIKTCTSETANDPPPCTRNFPVPDITAGNHYVDVTHDLYVSVDILETHARYNSRFQVNFRQLSTDTEHPLSYGSQLVDVTRASSEPLSSQTCVHHRVLFNVLGDRIALYGEAMAGEGYRYWSLHVWNWHEGIQADDIRVVGEGNRGFSAIRFLTKEKLLAFTLRADIELYDVEDLSQAPRLQARFALPYSQRLYKIQYPSVCHSASSCAHLAAPDDPWIWTTNPADRVLCLTDYSRGPLLIITNRLFFMNIPPSWFDTTSDDGLAVPWSSWGPQNSRCFRNMTCGVGGSRVVWVVPKNPANRLEGYQMHMMDFNPCAVARGIGEVVREPTTFRPFNQDNMPVTTYLPYVKVVSDHTLDDPTNDIALDEEQVLLFQGIGNEHRGRVEIFSL